MTSLTGEKRKQLRRRRLDYSIAVEGLPPLAGRSLNDAISSQGQQRDAASPGNGADISLEINGGGGTMNTTTTTTALSPDDDLLTDDHGSSNAGDGPYYNPRGDAYEFAAFAAWYLFLVLCCVDPTVCAYRRRVRAARLELERRERRMLAATRGPGGSDWYVEALAELERRRREDEANDAAAAAGVDGILAGRSLVAGNRGAGQSGNSTDVVLFRGMSADGRPITVLAGSGTTVGSSSTAATENADGPMRLVYLRRESSSTEDDGTPDGIRAFTGLNFGSNVNPFTSVAGATWFMAAAQQREQIQREERTRILDTVLENTSMWVNDGDLLSTEDGEVATGESTTTDDTDDTCKKQDNGKGDDQNDGFDNDGSSSKGTEDVADEKDVREEGMAAIGTEDNDPELPFLRLRPPLLGAINGDPNNPDKINQITRKHPAGRIVPNSCAICLSCYAIGDEVSWSTNGSSCPHAFHTSCIKLWLSKKEEASCPCCRQQFVSVEVLMQHLPAAEEEEEEQQQRRTAISYM